jgi:hypothetical protein
VKRGLLVLALSLVTTGASAQTLNPARFDHAPNVVSAAIGVDGPMTTELSYTRILDRRLALPFRITLPLAPGAFDGGLSAGSQMAWIRESGFGLSGRFELAAKREQTHYADFTRLGASFSMLAGYFRDRGSIALDLAWEPGLFTNVRPTEAYRSQFYPGARSTWMVGGNGYLRAGIQGVLRVTGDTELTLRTGMAKTDHLGALDLLPFYAMIGVSQGF